MELEVPGYSWTNMPTLLKLLRPPPFCKAPQAEGIDLRILTLQPQIRKPLAEVPGRCLALLVNVQQAATFRQVLFVGSCFHKEGFGLPAERGTVLAGCS